LTIVLILLTHLLFSVMTSTTRIPYQDEALEEDDLIIVGSDEDEDEVSETGTEASASDFAGNLLEVPDMMFFGEKECRAIFLMPSDQGVFQRVCGCRMGECKRMGHATLSLTEEGRAPEGVYETAKSRKFVDGKLGSQISKAVYEEQLELETVSRYHEMETVGAQWGTGPPPDDEEDEEDSDDDFPVPVAPAQAKGSTNKGAKGGGRRSPFEMFSPKNAPGGVKTRSSSSKSGSKKKGMSSAFFGQGKLFDFSTSDGGRPGGAALEKDPTSTPRMDGRNRSNTVPASANAGTPPSPDEHSNKAMMTMLSNMSTNMKELQHDVAVMKLGSKDARKAPPVRLDNKAKPPSALRFPPIRGAPKTAPPRTPPPKTPTPSELLASRALGSIAPQGSAKKLAQQSQRQVSGVATRPEAGGAAPTGWWYSVAKGKGGASGIYDSWAEASVMVNGISGAIYRKFREYEDAWDFVQKYLLQQAGSSGPPVQGVEPSVPLPVAATEAPSFPMGSAVSPRDAMISAGNSLLPLLELAGPDPSTKKEDELFGVDMGSEIDLRTGLCPPGLSTDGKRELANSLIDVVALPGGYHGGNEMDEGGNDMALLGAAMQEIVHQGRSITENSLKSDLNWRHSKRTSLRDVKSPEMLRKRIKSLLKLNVKVVKGMMRSVRNSCKRGGWHDQNQIEAWAQGGHFTRIVRDTMNWYLALHQHLMGLAVSEAPWSYVQVEVDHHVEELEVIRNTQDSRLQALCGLYVYLREGQSSNWHSTSLQYKRNVEIFTKSSDAGSISSESMAGSVSFIGCAHCGTSLHLGGKDKCPWGYLQPVKARKEGNKAIRCLAGDCEWDKSPVEALKEREKKK
jgi:hypothetical protein